MSRNSGFTLIELSIVLVIIGLIVGGILVGQNLISAAGIRAQMTQIEKYNTAVTTFYSKYQALPGDMPGSTASKFGFAARGMQTGEGDGNGIIQGIAWTNGSPLGEWEAAGETAMFWVDLSQAGLIEGSYTQGNATTFPGGGVVGNADITGSAIDAWLPQGKAGQGNYVYVWSADGYSIGVGSNYFGLSAVTNIAALTGNGSITSAPGLTPKQAYAMDTKIDDGFPQSGRVVAQYLSHDESWPDGTNALYSPPFSGGTQQSLSTCFDNGLVPSNGMHYSTGSLADYGSHVTCALSFRMQGAGR